MPDSSGVLEGAIAHRMGNEGETFVLDPAILQDAKPWARGLDLKVDGKGRLWLVGRVEGDTVYYQPAAWQAKNLDGGRLVQNYGMDLGLASQRPAPGTLQTNDPSFGRALMASPSTGTLALPEFASRVVEYQGPALLGLSLLALCAVLWIKRRRGGVA